MVKLTKRLIYGSIGRNILSYRDFEFLICQTVHIVNRRPVAFKEACRDSSGNNIPEVITPECLIRGYNLLSVNVIPDLQRNPEPDWLPSSNHVTNIKNSYTNLQKVRNKLIEIYNNEYMSNLIYQAVNKKDRYKPISHKSIKEGDIVLIKDPMTKIMDYPMAVVKEVIKNSNGEVTGAIVMKGKKSRDS